MKKSKQEQLFISVETLVPRVWIYRPWECTRLDPKIRPDGLCEVKTHKRCKTTKASSEKHPLDIISKHKIYSTMIEVPND